MNNIEILKLALSSSIVGGLIVSASNFIFSKKLKIRETRLKQLDKVLDKQFNAYENILNYFESFKTMMEIDPDECDNFKEFRDGTIITYPYFFASEDIYSKVTLLYRTLRDDNEKWVDVEMKKKLFEFEEYIFNLTKIIENVKDENYWKVGVIVRQDIQYYYDEIIELCFEFYNKGIFKMKIKLQNKNIEYDYEAMNNRIKKMNLYRNIDRLEGL